MYNGFVVKNPSETFVRRVCKIAKENGVRSDGVSCLKGVLNLRVGPISPSWPNNNVSGSSISYGVRPLLEESRATEKRILKAFGIKAKKAPKIPNTIEMTVQANNATYKGILTKV